LLRSRRSLIAAAPAFWPAHCWGSSGFTRNSCRLCYRPFLARVAAAGSIQRAHATPPKPCARTARSAAPGSPPAAC
jgi:hypothetical protein